MTKTILDKIKNYKLKEIEANKRTISALELNQKIHDVRCKNTFHDAIKMTDNKKNAIIGEIKKGSPSKGLIKASFDPQKIANQYEKGGACCLSVLTDSPSFLGCPQDLIDVKLISNLPVLRKDFIFDEYQILESKVMGADCILLILAALTENQARTLEEFAFNLGIEVLLETHNQDELNLANDMKSPLVGINNRNLHTFETNIDVTKKLAPLIKSEKTLISESGLENKEQLEELNKYGVKAFLIGETLMKSDNISFEMKNLVG